MFSRRHFPLEGEAVSIDTLMDLPVVSLGKGSAILAAVQRAHQSRGRVFRNDFTVSGFDTMLALVRNGIGVGLMPPQVFALFRTDADLASLPLEGDWHERHYMLSMVEGHAQEQALRNVVGELVGAAG
ncbi:hypothetical protein SDC9_136481 [bioreactor metagenome]|uniref:LysR substrate-binding domain-containing protein n=1 Tax=bioreactor metagenome TaxID=1076179 RepID=A0A645DLE4_9ZZZZ